MSELFQCPEYGGSLRLTPGACAQQWRKAKHAKHWDRLWPCKHCEIGAGHAGEKINPPTPKREHACVRCHDTGVRLLADGVCVSCRNREYELKAGKSRRGKPPNPKDVFWDVGIVERGKTVHLHALIVGTVIDTEPTVLHSLSSRMLEVLLKARRLNRCTVFCRVATPVHLTEGRACPGS